MDRLECVRTFVAVAEHASFVRAAAAMRISATKASRAVAELEAELGVPLLHRTTRTVALTAAGTHYLEHCRHALDALDEAGRAVRGQGGEPQGRVVVSAPVMFGRMLILPIVAELLTRHPALDIDLVLTDRQVRLVDEGVDVGVRIADLPNSALTAVRMREVKRVLVASPAYLARHGTPANPEELHDHALIGVDAFAPGDEWRFGGKGRTAVRLKPRLRVNDMAAAIAAAVAGLGITRVFCYQVDDQIDANLLVTLLDAFAPEPVPVSLVMQPHRQRSPAVRAFVDLAKARLRRS